jgi:hypothetical protein
MFRGHLTQSEQAALHAALVASHRTRVTVTITDLDGNVRGSLTPRVTAGQVEADRHHFGDPKGPTRRCSMTFLDPNNALGIDSANPGAGALYFDKRIEVVYGVLVPTVGWVDVPVFCGVPWRLQRTGDEVVVDADDLSVLGWGAAWRPKKLHKGQRKVDAIAEILADRVGLTDVRLPERKTKLAHSVSLGRQQHPWGVARRIASSMDLQLFVDGAGFVVGRRLPDKPIITFGCGDGGAIVDPIATTTDRDNFANVVTVIGRKPKGAKERVRYSAVAKKSWRNSPWKLAVNGVPNFVEVRVQNDHFRTRGECKKKADRLLADHMRVRGEVTCSILPWPTLEPGDKARFVTREGDVAVERIDSFSLPLTIDGGPMTLNFKAAPQRTRRRLRLHPGRKK